MIRLIKAFIGLIIIVNMSSPIKAQTSSRFDLETSGLIHFLKLNVLKKQSNIGMSKIISNSSKFQGCVLCLNRQSFFLNTIRLSAEEIKYVYAQMKDTSLEKQLSNNFDKNILIIDDSKIFNDSIIHFTNPIFIRNYSIAIIGYSLPITT